MASAAHAGTIYNVDRSISGLSVTGYITTNGTIGALTASDIEEWSLSFAGDGEVGALSSSDMDSIFFIGGTNLSATSTDLLFDFTGDSTLDIHDSSTTSAWVWYSDSTTSFYLEEILVNFDADVGDTRGFSAGEVISIASTTSASVPEPTTVVLLALGLFGLGFNRRKNLI